MLLSLSIVQSGRHVVNILLSTSSATPRTSQVVHYILVQSTLNIRIEMSINKHLLAIFPSRIWSDPMFIPMYVA
jgi:hypothetical protein